MNEKTPRELVNEAVPESPSQGHEVTSQDDIFTITLDYHSKLVCGFSDNEEAHEGWMLIVEPEEAVRTPGWEPEFFPVEYYTLEQGDREVSSVQRQVGCRLGRVR
jgi:hypothetical protein